MLLHQLVESDVDPQPGLVANLDPEPQDGVDIGSQHAAVEPVLGDPEPHRTSQLVGRLVHGHPVAELAQVVGTGHSGRAATDDPDALGQLDLRGSGDPLPDVAAVLFGAELLGHEALQRTDRDRTIDHTPTAGILARGGAHPSADRGERVGEAGREVGQFVVAVGDRGDVHAGVGVHRAGRQTRDVGVVVLEL